MVESFLELGIVALEAEALVEPLGHRVRVLSDEGGDVTDAKPVTSDGERGELDSLSREILVSGPRREIRSSVLRSRSMENVGELLS